MQIGSLQMLVQDLEAAGAAKRIELADLREEAESLRLSNTARKMDRHASETRELERGAAELADLQRELQRGGSQLLDVKTACRRSEVQLSTLETQCRGRRAECELLERRLQAAELAAAQASLRSSKSDMAAEARAAAREGTASEPPATTQQFSADQVSEREGSPV